jgi:hypothetical protein
MAADLLLHRTLLNSTIVVQNFSNNSFIVNSGSIHAHRTFINCTIVTIINLIIPSFPYRANTLPRRTMIQSNNTFYYFALYPYFYKVGNIIIKRSGWPIFPRKNDTAGLLVRHQVLSIHYIGNGKAECFRLILPRICCTLPG